MSESIPQPIAAELQCAMIAGNAPDSHWLELRIFADGSPRQEWFGVRDYRACARRAIDLSASSDVYVGAAPRVRQRGRAEDVERIWCLWADCDSPESVAALRNFHRLPNVVNRSGTAGRVHAWWQIPTGLTPAHAVRANRRLALALGADRVATDAARIMRVAGTLSHKTAPARPVHCVRLEMDAYSLADVVGGMEDLDEPKPAQRPDLRVASSPDATLDGILRTVSGAQPGNRNAALFWGACRLAEHDLEAHTDALREAALAAGLTERETARTIASTLDRTVAA